MSGAVRIAMAVLLLPLLAGCGDREGSIRAAVSLAETVYPGQLELHDSYLQKGYYDVALAKKDDPLVRVRFNIDPDPAECRVGTRCEDRLRRAYTHAVAAGAKLAALNTTFPGCGVPMLGLEDTWRTPASRLVIELPLGPADQQPALDRLTPCIASFRQALPAGADETQRALNLRILRPLPAGPAQAGPLTLDSRLPAARRDERSYVTMVAADDDRARAPALRLNPHHVTGSDLGKHLVEAARAALANDPAGGHVPERAAPWELRLDPQRLDVIRSYVLACSSRMPGQGPCRTDIAVRMRYDLDSGEASEIEILRHIRDDRGAVALPELPGR